MYHQVSDIDNTKNSAAYFHIEYLGTNSFICLEEYKKKKPANIKKTNKKEFNKLPKRRN